MSPSENDLIYDWNTVADFQALPRGIMFDDETLRDGLQSPSVVDPPIEKKLEILHLMNDIGIDTADVGLPGAGPRAVADVTRLVEEIGRAKLRIRANCAARTHVNDVRPIAEIVQRTGVPIEACTFIGSSAIRRYTEDWTIEQMLENTVNASRLCAKEGLEQMYVTEDTTRAAPETIRMLYTAAIQNGAKRVCVCDTVGHATPQGAANVVRFVKQVVDEAGVPGIGIDWHGHRDRNLDVMNSIAAIAAGATRVHGTALGIGERCGNTAMDLLLVNLKLLGAIDNDLRKLPKYVKAVSEGCSVPIPRNYPVFGTDAFETATGVHAAAVIKAFRKGNPWLANRVYSGVPADEFGLEQKISIGPMSGRSNVVYWLEKRNLPTTEQVVTAIFERAKKCDRLMTDDEVSAIVRMESGRANGQ